MPRPKPADPPPEPSLPAASRLVLALGALCVAAAALVASLRPGASNWGLHAAGFLDPTRRNLVLAGMLVACGLVAYGLFGRSGERSSPSRPPRRRGWRAILPWLLLAGWLLFGFWHPAREALLGDSAIWLQTVQAEEMELGSEPLSVRLLDAASDALRARGMPVDESLRLVSRVAGVGAGVLLVAIAFEIGGAVSVAAVVALLLTLGVSQFYFGYVESYPVALLFLLLYLWLGLRAARGAAAVPVAGIALGVAGAAHVTALLLLPSYAYLALHGGGSRVRQAVWLAVPLVVLAAAFVALGYGIENLAHPFRVATQAVASEGMHGAFLRPYPFVSTAHLGDVMNAALLAAPVALLLLAAGAIALPRRPAAWPAPVAFLAAAATGGVLVVCGLMTPVAPAQDWDLFAFLLAPAALLGVAVAAATIPRVLRGPASAGLAALSFALLLPFVLVNADSRASIARFERVVSDSARVAPYGRAYGNEILWILHRDRGDRERALTHARAAWEAEPTNPRHSVNLGHTLLSHRRVEEAIPYFQAATAAAPHRWDAPYNLGLSYTSLRRHPEALAALTEATRRDPERPEVWAAMVRTYALLGEEDSAVVVWNRLKERWPEYVEEQRKRYGAR